jgi:hypothetical protein
MFNEVKVDKDEAADSKVDWGEIVNRMGFSIT